VQKTVKPLKMILHLLQITCSSSTQLATMFPARSHRKVLILGGNLLESRNLLVFISQMIASFQIYSVPPKKKKSNFYEKKKILDEDSLELV
jgi:CO dehydrogenase/acetyl-CoA synthase epsilon subunit